MSRARSAPAARLTERLTELPSLPRDHLIDLWIEHMGRPPPRVVSTALLLRAVAYAVQEQQMGGLKRQDLRLLLKRAARTGSSANRPRNKRSTADDGSSSHPEGHALPVARRTSPAAADNLATAYSPAIPRTPRITLRPGTRLVRDWQGRSHVVDVRDNGFAWNGEIYRSLSAVALAITGVRWSGNRFFRLR